MSKSTKKVAGDRHMPVKMTADFSNLKLRESFIRSIPTTFITMTMLENEAGARYQPHHEATFVDFGSDRRSDAYVI